MARATRCRWRTAREESSRAGVRAAANGKAERGAKRVVNRQARWANRNDARLPAARLHAGLPAVKLSSGALEQDPPEACRSSSSLSMPSNARANIVPRLLKGATGAPASRRQGRATGRQRGGPVRATEAAGAWLAGLGWAGLGGCMAADAALLRRCLLRRCTSLRGGAGSGREDGRRPPADVDHGVARRPRHLKALRAANEPPSPETHLGAHKQAAVRGLSPCWRCCWRASRGPRRGPPRTSRRWTGCTCRRDAGRA
jgi:hypothetical protein